MTISQKELKGWVHLYVFHSSLKNIKVDTSRMSKRCFEQGCLTPKLNASYSILCQSCGYWPIALSPVSHVLRAHSQSQAQGSPKTEVLFFIVISPGNSSLLCFPLFAAMWPLKKSLPGVPVMAQWLTNPTRTDEVAGLIPGLTHGVKDPALPWAVV